MKAISIDDLFTKVQARQEADGIPWNLPPIKNIYEGRQSFPNHPSCFFPGCTANRTISKAQRNRGKMLLTCEEHRGERSTAYYYAQKMGAL